MADPEAGVPRVVERFVFWAPFQGVPSGCLEFCGILGCWKAFYVLFCAPLIVEEWARALCLGGEVEVDDVYGLG